jgi:hypothetical protein
MKFIIFIILAGSSFKADAKWVLYADLPTKNSQYFFSDSFKKVNGNFVVTVLKNFNYEQSIKFESDEIKYRSKVESQIIDCQKNIYANVRVEFFKDLDAIGENYVVPYNSIKWHPVGWNTIQEVLSKKICFNL